MSDLKLVVVSGLPGSGKSTVAEGLAKKLAFPIFSVDPIESAIIKSGIKRSFETGLAAYLVAQSLAGEQLNRGLSVIIDAVSPVREAREMWHNLSVKHQAKLIVVECVLEENLHKKRIESRIRNIHGIPEVTWEDVEKRRKEYLAWDEKHLVLDTANNRDHIIDKALSYIASE